MSMLLANISVELMHAWCPQKSKENTRYPDLGVMGSCKLPCGGWESTPGPLQEQVLHTTEPSISPALTMAFGPGMNHPLWHRLSIHQERFSYLKMACHTSGFS